MNETTPESGERELRSSGPRSAFGLLTTLGSNGGLAPSAIAWFGPVGAVVGAFVGGVWWGATQVFGPTVGAALAIVCDLMITGALHHDGLLDCADGLLGHLEKRRRLEVMAEPTVGAFAVVAGVSVMLVQFAALSSGEAHVLPVVALWVVSRATAGLALGTLPMARQGGLAMAFGGNVDGGGDNDGVSALPGWGAVVMASAVATVWSATGGPAAMAAGLAAGLGMLAWSLRRLGGITGDVLGATIVLIQTAGLVTLAA